MLDIIITHWTEPWEVGKKAFDILALQRCVDWNDIHVTLIHDGTRKYPARYFAGYPYAVEQVALPHCGIAAVRNWAINHSKAEWIKFCDFDDMFSGVYSLKCIMDVLPKAKEYDLLWFPIYGEYFDGRRFIKDERDPVVIHGKIFRRTFLNAKGIRFPEHLTWCEDSAFLAVLEMEIDHKRIGKITGEFPIYAWICRYGSLCNREEIKFQNRVSFFHRHQYVAEEFLRRGFQREHDMMVVRVMIDSYYTLFKTGIKEDTSEHEKEIWEYFDRHRDDYFRVGKEDYALVLAAVNKEFKTDITENDMRGWIQSHD